MARVVGDSIETLAEEGRCQVTSMDGLVTEQGEGETCNGAGLDLQPSADATLPKSFSVSNSTNGTHQPNSLPPPRTAMLDASSHRTELLGHMGVDCIAMAFDAADSIKAENSLEKMLAHQLAVAHKVALEMTDKAMFEPNVAERAKLLNVAARFMDTFQRGLLTIQKLRNGGEQTINVQHVHVGEGGQAIVGNVQTARKIK